jgi:TP901 family phage tail tape measure protein
MANPIKYSDLFQDDGGIDKLIADLKKLEKVYLDLGTTIQKGAKEIKSKAQNINVADPSSIKNLKELETAMKGVEAQRKKQQKGLDQINRLRQKANQLKTEEAKTEQTLKVEIQEKTRQLKEEARINSTLVGAYQRQSTQLNKLRRRYKDLAAAGKENSREAKRLKGQITALDTKLKNIDATVGQAQRNVGNYKRAFEGLRGVLMRGLGALGITTGIAGLVQVMRSSIGIFTAYEKANSNLAAILGVTTKETKQLSKELGATTAFTATQVTELQTEFAKLGFPTEDILNMTESTLAAASAMGSDLAETAKLTGATLKAFKLDSEEAARVNDVLAKATTASALDFAKLSGSMSTIAPVANAFGFSVEGTTALLGELSNAGFDASSAATATRNLLLKLADSSTSLAKTLKEPVKDLPSLVRGLKQLKEEGIDLGQALELTDKRSVAAFATFLEGTDSVLELNDALHNAAGTAKEMADKQLDNLSGAVTILNSAWEGFILSVEDGNNTFSATLKTIVQVTTELLAFASGTQKASKELTKKERRIRDIANKIIKLGKVVKIVVIGFAAFKAGVIAQRVAFAALSLTMNTAKITLALFSKGLKGATLSMKGLNMAMRANPIGFVVSALTTLITVLSMVESKTAEAAKNARERVKELRRLKFEQEQDEKERDKDIEKRFEARERLDKEELMRLKSNIRERMREEKSAAASLLKQEDDARSAVSAALFKTNEERIGFLSLSYDQEIKLVSEKAKELTDEIGKARAEGRLTDVEDLQKQRQVLTDFLAVTAEVNSERKFEQEGKERIKIIDELLNKQRDEENELNKDKLGILQAIAKEEKSLKDEQLKSKDRKRILEINKDLEKQRKLREDVLGITAKKEKEANEKLIEETKKINDAITLIELEREIRNRSRSRKRKNKRVRSK